jgi:serine/threonine-protein kinase SRPK3
MYPSTGGKSYTNSSDRTKKHVSIKAFVASRSGEDNRELVMLRAIRDRGDPNHPGCKHVSQFLDSFYVEGPNGRYLCIVVEMLGLKALSVADSCLNYRLGGHLAWQVSRQLLLAIDYLHTCGIVHGGKIEVLFKHYLCI